eukprot:1160994-Pelagomonas_calceolata.AAC.9
MLHTYFDALQRTVTYFEPRTRGPQIAGCVMPRACSRQFSVMRAGYLYLRSTRPHDKWQFDASMQEDGMHYAVCRHEQHLDDKL